MKSEWLHKNRGNSKLVVFCNGWGMDAQPFRNLASLDCDVLMFFDYSNLHTVCDVGAVARKYESTHLVSWSMGVWAGQKLFSGCPGLFRWRVAINGTLSPIDKNLGIPGPIFRATLEGFDKDTRFRFYRRMCREKSVFRQFLSKEPLRDLEDQRRELAHLLQEADHTPVAKAIYNKVLIADSDWVFPTVNQKRYWDPLGYTLIPGFHYIFYQWTSWDHLLAFLDDTGAES